MKAIVSARWVAGVLVFGCNMAFAQPGLPATNLNVPPPRVRTSLAPTAPTVASPAPPAAAFSRTSVYPSSPAGRRADVTYAQGQLEITADNSSLNQILRDISRQTGMTITGGVADQRVFGKYGPATPAVVLSSLLQGTGSNMLLLNNEDKPPAELILTPRQGGPTPPNPNASALEEEDAAGEPVRPGPPPAGQPQTRPPYASPLQPFGQPGSAPTPGTNPSTGSATDPGANADPANPASPTGVHTPQEIYQQLQQLQKAQPRQ